MAKRRNVRIPKHPNPGIIPTPRLAVVDVETYFDSKYSLKKMSTTNYVRDDRFKLQTLSLFLFPERRAISVPGDEAADLLIEQNWSEMTMIGHHTQFDALVLKHHFGIRAAYYADTLSMARPLFPRGSKLDLDTIAAKLGVGNKLPGVLHQTEGVRDIPYQLMDKLLAYNEQDVQITWKVFLMLLAAYNQEELDLIDLTIKAYADPSLLIDTHLAQKCADGERIAQEKKIRAVEPLIEESLAKNFRNGRTAEITLDELKTRIRSRVTFPKLLEAQGVEPPVKISPSTGKETFAFAKTDPGMQQLQIHPNPNVQALADAKLAVSSTINLTRPLKLIEHSDPALPVYLKYAGAHTFRWSGGDQMNPQNFPRDGDIRRCLLAPPGYKLVVVDSGQIEARVNAWFAGEEDLLNAFRDPDRDPYCEQAENTFGYAVDKSMKRERFVGKVLELGSGYQMGGPRLQFTLSSGAMGMKIPTTEDEAYNHINSYRASRPNIVQMWDTLQKYALPAMSGLWGQRTWEHKGVTFGFDDKFRCGYIILPNGMQMVYPSIKHDYESNRREMEEQRLSFSYRGGEGRTNLYGGKLDENVIQALARIIVAYQALPIIKAYGYKVVLLVHDEVVLLVPEAAAELAYQRLLAQMKTPLSWCPDLPVDAEGAISDFYLKP